MMMRWLDLASFRSVRGRLLALMAFIVIPLAVLSLVLATANYRTVVRGIELSQVQTLSNFAVRSRIWFRGSLRTLLATVLGVQADRENPLPCATVLRETLEGLPGYQAVSILRPGKPDCHASLIPGLAPQDLVALIARQGALPYVQQWAGARLALTRYDAVRIGSAWYLMIYAKAVGPRGDAWEAVLLTDAALLDQAFLFGLADGVTAVALMSRGKQVVISREVDEANVAWLPREERVNAEITRWEDRAADGTLHVYSSQIVAEPGLYVLARSDMAVLNAARIQLLILGLAPLLTLAFLFFTYARGIQSNVVGWISGIEAAARSRQLDPDGTMMAPLDPAMPQDIRTVAEAFNGMVEASRRREFDLRGLLASNQYLMRELHHRVKNSLQVIQSYLALSRRQQTGADSLHLAETEAKVHVLSAAYRLGLTDRGMNLVPVSEFAEELVGILSNSMRKPTQQVKTDIRGAPSLIVDRVIPLGLALVESIGAALAADPAASVSIGISPMGDDVLLRVSTSGTLPTGVPSARIMTGLAAQLGAVQAKPSGGEILHWTFRP